MFKDVIARLTKGKGLLSRSARGSVLLTLGSLTQEGARFLRNILLTRILMPDAFGAVAVILAFGALFESITEVGVKEAVIRDPNGEDKRFLNAAWAVSAVRCTGIYGMVFFLAPLMARFYQQPELAYMTRLALLSILFRGLMSPRVYVLVRRIRLPRYIAITNGGGTAALICTIVMGYVLRNGMALVYGLALEGFVMMVLSYALCPFVPGFVFDKDQFRSLMLFARGYLGLPILAFLYLRADVFVVRWLLPERTTGLYSMAASLAQVMSLAISKTVLPIFMPAFSEIREDTNRMRQVLISSNLALSVICLPAAAFAAMYGRSLLSIVYTPEYGVMGSVFGVLLFADALRVFNMPVGSAYLAMGKPQLQRAFSALRAAIVVVAIYPATRFLGTIGAACAVLLSMVLSHVFQVSLINKSVGIELRSYFGAYFIGSILCVPMIIVRLLQGAVSQVSPVSAMGLGLGVLVLTWAAAIAIYVKWGQARLPLYFMQGRNPDDVR